MRTSTLVQATADVVTIVNLRRGDVYKRLEEATYGERWTLQFGVVTDVMHNGEDAVISAVEFPQTWTGAPQPKLKTFGTDADLKLFAAQPEEVRRHFAEVLEGSRKALATAEAEWRKARTIDAEVQSVVGTFSTDVELTAPQTAPAELPPAAEDEDGEPAEPEADSDDTVAPF